MKSQSQRTQVIAEIGLNHNGSVEIAKKLIDAASLAGCDFAKFQKREVSILATKGVLDAEDLRFPEFGKTYREIRNHLEFTLDQYRELKLYTESKNLRFLCTAFDIPSADFLMQLGVDSFKLASHSLTNIPLLEHLAKIGLPVFMSTGMCELDEMKRSIDIFKQKDCPLTILHCVSAYPTPMDQSNLRLIPYYKEQFGLNVGYSGHEIGWLPTLVAVGLGATAIERHITLDKAMVGFDHKLSLTPDELIQMVRDIRNVELTLGSGVKVLSETESITRRKYHVSFVSTCRIAPGVAIEDKMLTLKNPGTGIPAHQKAKLLGRKAKVEIAQDTLLSFDLFE